MTDTAPKKLYRLEPILDRHREESRRFILEAAEAVKPGRAIVLGAGGCGEIPLRALVERFDQVLLNDLDTSLIEPAIVACQFNAKERAKLEISPGRPDRFDGSCCGGSGRGRNAASDEQDALNRMSDAVDATKPDAVEIDGKFDLVVASCLLCQLHVVAMHRAQAEFLKRFPGKDALLGSTEKWTLAIERMARQMESQFVDRLVEWTAPGGRIYLSETVRVAFIERASDGAWTTEGTFRLLKSTTLADYLDNRFRIESERGWPWIFQPPQKPGDRGRLFDVQAAVLSMP